MTEIKRLIEVLQSNIQKRQKDDCSSMRYDTRSIQHHFEEMRQEMSRYYRPPWIMTGIYHRREKMLALRNRQLDNWQIDRISLSKRSYECPKNYRGIKIPSIGKDFSTNHSKDPNRNYPYLYQSDLKKIEKIRQEIHKHTFAKTNSVRHEYFGFGKNRPNPKQMRRNKFSSVSVG